MACLFRDNLEGLAVWERRIGRLQRLERLAHVLRQDVRPLRQRLPHLDADRAESGQLAPEDGASFVVALAAGIPGLADAPESEQEIQGTGHHPVWPGGKVARDSVAVVLRDVVGQADHGLEESLRIARQALEAPLDVKQKGAVHLRRWHRLGGGRLRLLEPGRRRDAAGERRVARCVRRAQRRGSERCVDPRAAAGGRQEEEHDAQHIRVPGRRSEKIERSASSRARSRALSRASVRAFGRFFCFFVCLFGSPDESGRAPPGNE